MPFWPRKLMVPWDALGRALPAGQGRGSLTDEATSRVTCPELWLGMLGCTLQERLGALGEGLGEGYKVDEGTGASL